MFDFCKVSILVSANISCCLYQVNQKVFFFLFNLDKKKGFFSSLSARTKCFERFFVVQLTIYSKQNKNWNVGLLILHQYILHFCCKLNVFIILFKKKKDFFCLKVGKKVVLIFCI